VGVLLVCRDMLRVAHIRPLLGECGEQNLQWAHLRRALLVNQRCSAVFSNPEIA
jgi:hypothetical protein